MSICVMHLQHVTRACTVDQDPTCSTKRVSGRPSMCKICCAFYKAPAASSAAQWRNLEVTQGFMNSAYGASRNAFLQGCKRFAIYKPVLVLALLSLQVCEIVHELIPKFDVI